MRKELITLTRQEHERYAIIKRVLKREMKQAEAADVLNLTDRQVRNLRDKVREKGVGGMAHSNRGKASPRKMAKVEDAWRPFYSSGTRAFQPGKIEASKSYEWKWTRWDSSGKRRAGDGRYRLVLSAPGVTPDKVIKEFDLKNAPYLLK